MTLRIVCAWELGAGLGHLGRLAPWVAALAERGVAPVLAVRDLQAAAGAPDLAAGLLMQAPVMLHGPLAPGFEVGSYAELLLGAGYGNFATLATLVRAWRNLLQTAGAGALIAEHAPTAILAARLSRIPVLHLGDGFTMPPPGAASFVQGPPQDAARGAAAAHHVMRNVNRLLEGERLAPLGAIDDLLRAEQMVLATFAELDHYRGHQRVVPYAGHFEMPRHDAIGWRGTPGPRILAYLKPTAPHFETLVDLLGRLPAQTRIYASGLCRANTSETGYGLIWSEQPLPMASAASGTDLVICHAGHGSICAALLAGKPLLLVPTVQEQMLSARNVEALGAGAWIHPSQDAKRTRRTLERCIEDDGMRAAAQGFADKYAGLMSGSTARLAESADRLVALACGGSIG